jgi:hypothetical protein
MPDEGAVATIEAPAADAALDSSVSTDSSAVDSGTSDAAGTSSDAADNADTPQPGETGHLRGSELYKAVKDKLKTAGLDPQALKSIRNAIWMADKADKLSGGNLEAIEQVQGLVSRLADDPESGATPEQIIEQTLDERNFWRDFDSKFEKGDVSLIPMMIEANPEAFQKMAPAAMDRFADVNPEGFSAYIAKSAVGYLNGKQIPVQWAILETFLPSVPDFPGKDRFVAALSEVYKAFDSLEKMAANPITPKKVEGKENAAGGLDQREQSLTEREMSVRRQEWNGETSQIGIQLRNSELERIAATQKVTLDEADKAKIRAAVNEEFTARCAANSKYGQAMRGYLQAGNKRAYADRAASEYKKLIPGITARHTQAIIDAKKSAGAKKSAAQASVAGNGQRQPQQPSNGSGNLPQWLSGHPKTLNKRIDLVRTTNSMLQRNEAYLVGEKGLFKWKPKEINA